MYCMYALGILLLSPLLYCMGWDGMGWYGMVWYGTPRTHADDRLACPGRKGFNQGERMLGRKERMKGEDIVDPDCKSRLDGLDGGSGECAYCAAYIATVDKSC